MVKSTGGECRKKESKYKDAANIEFKLEPARFGRRPATGRPAAVGGNAGVNAAKSPLPGPETGFCASKLMRCLGRKISRVAQCGHAFQLCHQGRKLFAGALHGGFAQGQVQGRIFLAH